MRYLLVLHEALDENLIDEIMLAGVKINRSLFSSDIFIKVICEGSMGLRFNGDFEYLRFLYKGIIIKHNKTEPTYTKTSLFLCEKRRFFMARTEKGVVTTI